MTKKVTNKRAKRRLSKSGIVLIVGLIIILVPCLIFGWILVSAALQTGTPIFGDRYEGDLEPAITDDDLSRVESAVKGISGVQDVTTTLISGQLRVNVDMDDALTSEEINALLPDMYNAVDGVLSVSTYFTSTEDKKMYDLAINVYNFVDAEDENMIYYIVTKNAMMENYSTQLVSEPIDAELASDLRGEGEPTETPTAPTE